MAGKKEGEERENPHRSEEESMTFLRENLKIIWNGSELFRTKVCRELLLWKADGSDPCQINFQTGMVADHYDRLKVTLLNRNEGMIDSMVVKFGDVWGLKKRLIPIFATG